MFTNALVPPLVEPRLFVPSRLFWLSSLLCQSCIIFFSVPNDGLVGFFLDLLFY